MVRWLSALAFALALLAAPARAEGFLDSLFGGRTDWPPDRKAWTAAPVAARATHARELHRALEAFPPRAHEWRSEGLAGRIAVRKTWEIEGVVCRSFDDTIVAGGKTRTVRDIACWGEGWMYALGRGRFAAVLGPALEEPGKAWVVKKAETLRQIAGRAKVKAAALAELNPGWTGKVPAGTRLLLP